MLDGDEWVINGHKWFTTGANRAAYTTVMCRTEDESVSPYLAFSMIIVPTDTPGYTIVRETPVLGIRGGHCEVMYDDVRVPAGNLLGPRGHGFVIAQERLGPGRIFHCMRWLGQAQRAFELHVRPAQQPHRVRRAAGEEAADAGPRVRVLRRDPVVSTADAARRGRHRPRASRPASRSARSRWSVPGCSTTSIDRAIQAYGAAGLTDDTPLSHMYRAARFGRIYDGPDEVHIHTVARRILKEFRDGTGIDFAGPTRSAS